MMHETGRVCALNAARCSVDLGIDAASNAMRSCSLDDAKSEGQIWTCLIGTKEMVTSSEEMFNPEHVKTECMKLWLQAT